MENTTLSSRNDARSAARLREYQNDMAHEVRLGNISEETANEWVNALADRLNRDGAWS